MPNIFDLIGSSWDFYRKQPVFNQVLLWLMVVPVSLMFALGEYRSQSPYFQQIEEEGIKWGVTDVRLFLAGIALDLFLSLVLLWGVASVLVVAKRLLKSKAGRARTSFQTVTREGSKYILVLFITSLLRECFTFFWTLVLVIPGFMYFVRTAFFHVTVVCEDLGYRQALVKSKEVTIGHFWTTFSYLIGLAFTLFAPVAFFMLLLYGVTGAFDPRLTLAVHVVSSGLFSMALMILVLSTVILYGELKKLPHPDSSWPF